MRRILSWLRGEPSTVIYDGGGLMADECVAGRSHGELVPLYELDRTDGKVTMQKVGERCMRCRAVVKGREPYEP